MILEFWQGQGDPYAGLTVVVRAIYAFAGVGAAGLALFMTFMSDRLTLDEQKAARRWLVILVAVGVVATLVALPLRAIVLARGAEGVFRFELYPVILRSRIGDAFFLRLGGLALCLFALRRTVGGAAIGVVGAVLVAMSFAAMGHSTLYRPRQELAALVTVHLLAVGFWVGSLFGIVAMARRRDARSAALDIDRWSRQAMLAVAILAVTGGLAAWYLIGTTANLMNSWHGWGFIAKVALVALMLLIATLNKFRHTRMMATGDVLAAAALRRSIGREIVIAFLVFYAAAEMVSVHPLDYGHRIPA